MASELAPDTADGWAVLHQFYRVDWTALSKLPNGQKEELFNEAREHFASREKMTKTGQSAYFHVLGEKGSFAAIHFRSTFDLCAQEELEVAGLRINQFLTLHTSFVSVVEMGMYHTTKKLIETLEAKGLKQYSPEWNAEYAAAIEPHKKNLDDRRFTEIPDRRYFCFYPMNKRRDYPNNWYRENIDRRSELMMEHGMTGRRYAGKIQQVISGSIGFDDWEWGVDLFADDPLDIKHLIYEMRFDEVTALFAEFGPFYFGLRIPANSITSYFSGKIPSS